MMDYKGIIKSCYRTVYSAINKKPYSNFKKVIPGKNGLTYIPSLTPELKNSVDSFSRYSLLKHVPEEFSSNDRKILRYRLKKLGPPCRLLVEIGVARNFAKSSTGILVKNKMKKCIYIGIDIEDKSALITPFPNSYFIKSDSGNIKKIMAFIKKTTPLPIDLLFIDGNHSVNMVLNDWKFSKYVRKNGYIILHDTSVHPGPFLLFDAIDKKRYSKKKYFENRIDDWGIGVIQKLF
jgi:uncharacterized membrane protein (UPF0127 family)